jgi:hypothetical protein
MKNLVKETTNLYALLIGIDYYQPNRLPDGSSYRSLKGCVRDINHVEEFLKRQPKAPTKIIKLTASNPKADEAPDQLPTYENMVAQFKELTQTAQPGDLVYIHYSGHGGRAKTIYPDLKGKDDVDEVLVPTDIGNSTAHYLRDLELAKIVHDMVDKGLVVTLVLDCCHSGEPTRGGDAEIRGLDADVVDTTPRPTDSLVATTEELVQIWQALTDATTRKATAIAGMLPEVEDYVVLAACRPSESAYEYAFDGKERNGALTYWLLDTLNQHTPGLTYKSLHERINAKVHSQFAMQTPMLLGKGDRLVFGSHSVSTEYAVTVMQVEVGEDNQPKRVKLDAGQAQGLRKGAEFVIYPLGITNFKQVEQRLAVSEITERGAAQSWAEIKTILRQERPIEQGAQAVMTAAPVSLVRKVRLLTDNPLPGEINRDVALQAIELAMVGNGWVELVAESEAADYQVALRKIESEEEANRYQMGVEQVIYEICDRTGATILLKPALNVEDSKAAASVVKRLVHLSKYQATQELDNHDPNSPLREKVSVKLLGKQADYESGDPPDPKPFDNPSQPQAKVGETVFLEIKNNYSDVLNIVVLDLQSNWAIDQMYPASPGSKFIPLDPGSKEVIPIQLSLPEGDEHGVDIFKVFATIDAANFRWLELPPLNQPILSPSKRGLNVPSNSLEELLAALGAEQPPRRKGNAVAFPSREWMTTQVTARVTS